MPIPPLCKGGRMLAQASLSPPCEGGVGGWSGPRHGLSRKGVRGGDQGTANQPQPRSPHEGGSGVYATRL